MGKCYSRDDLYKYIGPPLRDSFVKELGEDLADQGADFYREYYFTKGLFETEIYDGIKELLENLNSDGFKIYLDYFSYVSGSSNNKNTKKKVIEHLLKEMDLKTSESIMIGDRSYDIEAARKLNIKTIAVTYGYGNKKEFENASFIANFPLEIKTFIDKFNEKCPNK